MTLLLDARTVLKTTFDRAEIERRPMISTLVGAAYRTATAAWKVSSSHLRMSPNESASSVHCCRPSSSGTRQRREIALPCGASHDLRQPLQTLHLLQACCEGREGAAAKG